MNKLKFETPDMVTENVDKIAALFPSAITEMRGEDGEIKRGVNFEVLKQLLSRDVVDGDECYEFTWVGKRAAMAEASRPITKTLRPVKADSRDWDTTENLYIEGDNLEVLKILQESYLGKVKMIYIDPPYNTGNDFIYKAGYKNICEIGKERIRRAGDKIQSEHPDAKLDTGFRVFRVDESNMEDVYYHPEELTQTMLGGMVSNIKPDRTDLDLLYACLLDWGVEISLSHTQAVIDGCTVHNVDNGALCACFDERVPLSVIDYMAKQQPLRAVFRDSSFAADDSKINVTEIFKNLSPDTKVKVI